MLKIGHFSDSHQGYRAGNLLHPKTRVNLREQDGYDALNEVIDQMIKEKVDVVIHSGDIFHSAIPSIRSIVEVQSALNKLVQAGIPFYNIAGNHDASDSVTDIPSNRVLNMPFLELHSYIEPYVIKEISKGVVCHFISHHGFVEQKKTMKKLKLDESKFNILVTHGSVFDTSINAVLHTEGEPREIVIPEEVMNMPWDYTLMGHIHERGWVGSTDKLTDTENRKQFYGGSLIRRGFVDKPCKLERGWTLWTVDKDNREMTPTFFNIKQRPQYDLAVFCENKTPDEIIEDIQKQFEKIDFSTQPIVRATFIDLKKSVNTVLNWNAILSETKKCLTFVTKIVSKEEVKRNFDEYSFSFDLMTAYNEYWNIISESVEEEIREDVKKTSVKYLKKGKDKLITSNV